MRARLLGLDGLQVTVIWLTLGLIALPSMALSMLLEPGPFILNNRVIAPHVTVGQKDE